MISSESNTEPVKPADIRLAAMNLLARREHSAQELRQKLVRRFADADLIEQQLQLLQAENLQNDGRYAQSFVRQRVERGIGRSRIRQEMRQRGLDAAAIDVAFEAIDVDWYELAERVWRKKFGSGQGAVSPKEAARRQRFMQYRGFEREYYAHLLA